MRSRMNNNEQAKQVLHDMIDAAETICLLGHISPDGDCIGSTLGLQRYINNRYPDKQTVVYLDQPSNDFSFLPRFQDVCCDNSADVSYDLVIACDVADAKRVGKFTKYLQAGKTCYLVDHHITNQGFGDYAHIIPDASSTCEIIYELLEPAFIDKDCAAAIYTGIINDTGVFKYSCTKRRTMEIASDCMEKGIPFGTIIDDTFYSMEPRRKRLLGKVLMDLQEALDGKFVYSILDYEVQKAAGCEHPRDTDGFIDVIRTTKGSAAAAFFHQLPEGKYKMSLRSNSEDVDVAEIASHYNGGGHTCAAGGTIEKDLDKSIQDIIRRVEEKLERQNDI